MHVGDGEKDPKQFVWDVGGADTRASIFNTNSKNHHFQRIRDLVW